jgi:hypothetical protein
MRMCAAVKTGLVSFMTVICVVCPVNIHSQIIPTQLQIVDNDGVFQPGLMRAFPADSQYVAVSVWSLLDSCNVDSVVKMFPNASSADTTYLRPDGKLKRLFDLTRH